MKKVRSIIQVIACVITIALLAIVVYPWTSILPAPRLNVMPLFVPLLSVFSTAFLCALLFCYFRFLATPALVVLPRYERLALICIRLC